MGDWSYWLVHFGIIAFVVFTVGGYYFRKNRSKNWPSIDAVILSCAPGHIQPQRGVNTDALFVDYGFEFNGNRYGGVFVLYGANVAMNSASHSLVGVHIAVRYDPANPNISLLANPADTNFFGLTSSQFPMWLQSAPTPSIFEIPGAPNKKA